MSKRYLHIRRMGSGEIVKTLDVSGRSDREVERIEKGLLRNMDLDNFCVDDSKESAERKEA